MQSPLGKTDLESVLGSHFAGLGRLGVHLELSRPAPERVSTGIAEVDALTGGLPRGAITEIFGPASSGRTSLLAATLARATQRSEVCALVDTNNTFDPLSATQAGIDLGRLLWVRCAGASDGPHRRWKTHPAEQALQVTDWLVQGGGFGIVALDLGDVPPRIARRISLTSWFRLRRAIENTPSILIVIEQEPLAKTCASLVLEIQKKKTNWAGRLCPGRLLDGTLHRLAARKPVHSAAAAFALRAAWTGKQTAVG